MLDSLEYASVELGAPVLDEAEASPAGPMVSCIEESIDDIETVVDSNEELAAILFFRSVLGLSKLIRVEMSGLSAGVTWFIGNMGSNLLPVLELGFELDARGDSSLVVGPRFVVLGDISAGDGELDVVEDEDDEEAFDAAVTVVDDVEAFDVDFDDELEGDANEGEVDIERFGLPILFGL